MLIKIYLINNNKKPATRQTRGFHFTGKALCSSQTHKCVIQSVNCVLFTLHYFFLNGAISPIVNCSPNLSSSNCFDIYSAILASFFPIVST